MDIIDKIIDIAKLINLDPRNTWQVKLIHIQILANDEETNLMQKLLRRLWNLNTASEETWFGNIRGIIQPVRWER